MLNPEIQRAPADAASDAFALWNLGFRPFYLLASSFAALSILLWIGQYSGGLPACEGSPPGRRWRRSPGCGSPVACWF